MIILRDSIFFYRKNVQSFEKYLYCTEITFYSIKKQEKINSQTILIMACVEKIKKVWNIYF